MWGYEVRNKCGEAAPSCVPRPLPAVLIPPSSPPPLPLQCGGLAPSCVQRLLSDDVPATVLIDVLLVVSQLARVSKEGAFNTYDAISKCVGREGEAQH